MGKELTQKRSDILQEQFRFHGGRVLKLEDSKDKIDFYHSILVNEAVAHKLVPKLNYIFTSKDQNEIL